jgi:hypothetical protein
VDLAMIARPLPRFSGYQRRLTAPQRLAALTVQAATIARLQADAVGHAQALAERDGAVASIGTSTP